LVLRLGGLAEWAKLVELDDLKEAQRGVDCLCILIMMSIHLGIAKSKNTLHLIALRKQCKCHNLM
jgi:hypothetical protein